VVVAKTPAQQLDAEIAAALARRSSELRQLEAETSQAFERDWAARELAATLRTNPGTPSELRADIEGDQIIFHGPGAKSGSHSLSIPNSTKKQILAQWKDFVEINGQAGQEVAPPAYQPGDRVLFQSGSAGKGWRQGKIVRVTPTRVLVEYSFDYDLEHAKKTGQPPRRHETWKKRNEVRK
jgi:hypothetical protein